MLILVTCGVGIVFLLIDGIAVMSIVQNDMPHILIAQQNIMVRYLKLYAHLRIIVSPEFAAPQVRLCMLSVERVPCQNRRPDPCRRGPDSSHHLLCHPAIGRTEAALCHEQGFFRVATNHFFWLQFIKKYFRLYRPESHEQPRNLVCTGMFSVLFLCGISLMIVSPFIVYSAALKLYTGLMRATISAVGVICATISSMLL